MGEIGLEPQKAEHKPWERDADFLMLNPSGTTPVFQENEIAIPGASVIAEYLDETRGLGVQGRRLLPSDPAGRVEVRRLLDWFNVKFYEEVTVHLVQEKIYKRFSGGAPDTGAIRAARANMRYHLRYIGYLSATRNWLAGSELTYADLAAAAHLSCADYLSDVPWEEDEMAKTWYARVKSRPAFRTLLADRVPGMIPPAHYADLDF